MKGTTQWLLVPVLLSLAAAGSARAASTLTLLPSSTSVAVGDTVSLTIAGEFPDGILGGGMDLFFDSGLFAFESLVFNSALGDDDAFRRDPDLFAGELNGIAFGNFDGLSGALTIAEVSFTALASGTGAFALGANEGGPPDQPGPFVSLGGMILDDIAFGSASVSVQAVPLPGALWLMAGALGWLVSGAKRRA